MSELKVFLIDVAWGDAIFIDSKDSSGNSHYALVDCNDTKYDTAAQTFIAKYFERNGLPDWSERKPLFEYVFLTHWHVDHYQGLKAMMKKFGTRNFYYPKNPHKNKFLDLIRYANRSSNVQHHQAIDSTKMIPQLGDVNIDLLWPPYNYQYSSNHENNNSLVMNLTLDNVPFILTGDAEADVWSQISNQLPNDTGFFKVPHHGSVNGSMDKQNPADWFHAVPDAKLGISSHVRPHKHPHQRVVNLFKQGQRDYYRTDEQYHLLFQTDGQTTDVKYSHF